MTTTTKTRTDTRNAAWGFYGTIERAGLDAERAWDAAFDAITDATDAHDPNCYGPEGVRDFLDSRSGRHFADEVSNALHSGMQLEAAISAATDRHMGWTISHREEKDYGIPAGTAYLTGWVQHYAITAEMDG